MSVHGAGFRGLHDSASACKGSCLAGRDLLHSQGSSSTPGFRVQGLGLGFRAWCLQEDRIIPNPAELIWGPG